MAACRNAATLHKQEIEIFVIRVCICIAKEYIGESGGVNEMINTLDLEEIHCTTRPQHVIKLAEALPLI